MITALRYLLGLGLIIQCLIGLSYFISSIHEKESRATWFGAIQFLSMLALAVIFFALDSTGFFETSPGSIVLIAAFIVALIGLVLLVIRTGANPAALKGTAGLTSGDVEKYNETDIVFSRNSHLQPGSEIYKKYYEAHPELEEGDAARREDGGPLGQIGRVDRPFEEPNVASITASSLTALYLSAPNIITPRAFIRLREDSPKLTVEQMTERVKGFAKYLGADIVGITKINPNWIYSHRGQAPEPEYGQPIELDHTYAIVFGVEMRFEMVATAPHSPTTMESIDNYSRGAGISTKLASFIANMGHSATANHLRHYDGMMVPLAVDAGLGEIGRLGYLMTKELGPRLRLAAVTTDMELIPDKPIDIGVKHFCTICKKCATSCPSNSIPEEDQPSEINGTMRWKLNAETCYEYWGKVGSDCNICMRVCPWSHDRTFPHKLIVELVSRNKNSRILFNLMDDVFYGKKPKSKEPPAWASYKF